MVSGLLDGAIIDINSATSSVNLASLSTSLYGGILPYTIVNVNANVIGNNGSNGSSGNSGHINGYSGGSGTSPFDFSGFNGFTVKLINNATIKGGNGGNGGNGYNSGTNIGCGYIRSYGGSGGIGASWKSNDSGVNLILQGNTPTTSTGGSNGINGYIWNPPCG